MIVTVVTYSDRLAVLRGHPSDLHRSHHRTEWKASIDTDHCAQLTGGEPDRGSNRIGRELFDQRLDDFRGNAVLSTTTSSRTAS